MLSYGAAVEMDRAHGVHELAGEGDWGEKGSNLQGLSQGWGPEILTCHGCHLAISEQRWVCHQPHGAAWFRRHADCLTGQLSRHWQCRPVPMAGKTLLRAQIVVRQRGGRDQV